MANRKDKTPVVLFALARLAGSLTGFVHSLAAGRQPVQETRPDELRHQDISFEHSDISARGVVITGAAVLAGALIVSSLVFLYSGFLAHQRAQSSPPPLPIELHGNPMPPEPRLQASPTRDLRSLRMQEDSVLGKYAWIDKSKGVAALPIERAMEIIAQRGIPPQKAPDSLKLFEPRAGSRVTGFEGKVEPEPR